MTLWRIWAKAIGEKSGKTDEEADMVAAMRSLIVLFNLIVGGFIVAGIIHHWG